MLGNSAAAPLGSQLAQAGRRQDRWQSLCVRVDRPAPADNATKTIDVTRKEVLKASASILELQAMRRPTGLLNLI
jgi:hypothetical protein